MKTKPCVCKTPRRKPREFKLRDLERIITRMLDQEFTPGQLLGVALVATGGLIHFELIFRQLRVIRAVAGALIAFTLLRQLRVIIVAIKNIVEEISDRLWEFPQLRKSISIVDEATGILGAVVKFFGGLLGAAKLLISLDEAWVDGVRVNAYNYLGMEPPDYTIEIPDLTGE